MVRVVSGTQDHIIGAKEVCSRVTVFNDFFFFDIDIYLLQYM